MLLPLTIALLGATVVVTPLLTRLLGRRAGWPLAVLYLAAAALLVPAGRTVLGGDHVTWSRPWAPHLQVDLALRADGLGMVFAMIALIIGAIVFLYSVHYLGEGRQTSFYLVMAAFTLAMVGLVLADDLVLLFICWELTSLASFLLIARSGRSGEQASMRTLLLTFVGGVALLVAVALMIERTRTTSLSAILAADVWSDDRGFATLVAVLVLVAGFSKSAQFPFHVWLPDAMAAITPVSAYLHAAAVVKAGIFLMLRFSPAFHDVPAWQGSLIVVGLFTAGLAGVIATRQRDLKKLMAYSTVSQLGFITAAIGVGTPTAMVAAVLHTIAHALFKSGLFMMVGVVDHATGTRDLARLPQLYRAMPGSFVVTVLGCASMAGIPPMLGFVSKESVLHAFGEAPGGEWAGYLALAVGALATVATFVYCGRIVLGGFVDGTSDRRLHAVPRPMIAAAALPIVASVPLAAAVGVLDLPVQRAAEAARPGAEIEPHLALWHGVTLELVVTVLVILAGSALLLQRRRLAPFLQRPSGIPDGAAVLRTLSTAMVRAGDRAARLTHADHPTRHVAVMLSALTAVIVAGTVGAREAIAAQPLVDNLSRPVDGLLLVLISAAVLGVCLTRSRLAATLCLGAVGILATAQLIGLGAPDVGLTQLLVESLTVVVVMLVLQKLPLRFGRADAEGRQVLSGKVLLAVGSGLAVALGTWALTGRRERTDVAEYYLGQGPEVTGGANVVNTILVEFRALDTLGELAVLGVAGVAIIAVLSSVRHEYIDPPAEHNKHHVPTPELDLRPAPSTAHRAIHDAWSNAVPLQLMVRFLNPILAVISAMLLWRGHNDPGGGFIAALVGSAVVGLLYLSTSRDRQIGPPRLPLLLIGGGVATAITTGLAGLVVEGAFLEPIRWHLGDLHLSSALIFDLGVYAAVLGLVVVAFNVLGTSVPLPGAPGAEMTRERVDESVEGELPGPMDTVRGEGVGESPAEPGGDRRVGPRTTHLSDGTRPKEVGR